MRSAVRAVAVLALAVAASGCGGPKLHKIEGVVTLDGKPLAGATVVFQPEAAGAQPVSGVSAADGTFALSSTRAMGAPPGRYRVLVTKAEKSGDRPGGDLSARPPGETARARDKNGPMRPGMPTPPTGGITIKNLLPARYGNADETPFTVTVPSNGPIKLELTSS